MPTEPDNAQGARAPRLSPVSDAAEAYRLVYHRVATLLRGRDEVGEVVVPACPAWTIRDTLAHLAGAAQDVVSGDLAGVGSESWTRTQINRLGHKSVDELLDLWGGSVGLLAAQMTQGAPELAAGQLIFDVLTHEHDIRGAVGEPGDRTADLTYQVALGFLTTMYDLAFRGSHRVAMRLTTPSIGTVQLGDPDTATDQPVISLSDFDALRAFGGRRSERQLSALPWQGTPPDPPPVARNHAIRPPRHDLVE
ncbi:maleylpyruvate isomerase N-terminal domain-containing protein [Mycobacterium koreense]|uniref:Uncharacterized protein n=1 Tax=Mycolicibacillus koreensis TaxID=1069220 RepID=A0A7I7SIK9_9MYCO|nr:maleylpyruvate isomerase N-terminal domain-containing protein [Mycolicibacillus koreensis]MCV7250447.1 maleylpyruvate isomerase N-terminal domain-containing protein [Mycolicibacillus koreensis]OSC27778.1 hypothetical protein B8W67_18020 [Mycolicibacillus koreensis]BBY55786.1 hypothetical protein MKOR_30370 [Mycolicibacillus koreensis]